MREYEDAASEAVKDDLPSRVAAESRVLARLGAPILVVQLLQVAVVTIDTIMAGRYSARDLSGVAIGGSIWFPIFLLLFGLLSALTPTVAQLHGARDYRPIARNVYQAGWLALLIAPVVMALLVFFLPPLLVFIGSDPSIRPITTDYLGALVLGLPPLLLYNVLRFYSDGVSLTKPAVAASVIGLLVNIPLNYVLIYGKFGFPELGGVGCGWASAIAFYLMFFYMAVVVCRKNYAAFYLYKKFHGLHWPTLKSLLKIGMPIGFAHFVESSMFGVIALFLASLGPTTVAAHQIALNFSALVFMIPLSMSIALTIRIGFLVGAAEQKEARFTAFYGVGIAILYALLSASLLFLFRTNIAELYNREPDVVALASTLLLYAAAFQLGDALQVTAAGALRGYKDTRPAMYIMVLTFWCFGLPLGYALGLTDLFGSPMHAEGFWSGLVVGLLMAGGLLIWRLQHISRRYVQPNV